MIQGKGKIIVAQIIGTTSKQDNIPRELGQPQSPQPAPSMTAQTALTIEITTPPDSSTQLT